MKVFLTVVFVSAVFAFTHSERDLSEEVENAKRRFDNDFFLGIWYRSNEAIVESRERLLRLYTHYTIQQAEQVVNHIAKYRNLSLSECSEKRGKLMAAEKNMTRVLKLTECIFKNEDSTIQAYKMTGYNLHNCIRMAQIETETRYLEVLKNFETIKRQSLEMRDYYGTKVDNCLDRTCVIESLMQSVDHYEKLQEDVEKNVTEINGINTRYLLSHIALNCVSNAMIQIEQNYEIGKKLVSDCFRNETADDCFKNGAAEDCFKSKTASDWPKQNGGLDNVNSN